MKFGRNVPQENKHQLTESDFRYDVIISRLWRWRYFKQISAATWWVNMSHLPPVP